MDPITTAIVTGLANLSKDAIKDSYNALKGALKRKFNTQKSLVEAVDRLEQQPNSEDCLAILHQEVKTAKIEDDREILQLAEHLQKQLNIEASTVGKYNNEFLGSAQGNQFGEGNVQTNTFNN